MNPSEQTWYAFECAAQAHAGTSVMLDVRLDGGFGDPPVVPCPCCHAEMEHLGTWSATENGFGGLSDGMDTVMRHARRAADLHGDEIAACHELGRAIDALDATTRAQQSMKSA